MATQTLTKAALRQELHRLIDLLPPERIIDIHRLIRAETMAATDGIKPVIGSSNAPPINYASPQPASTLNLFATALDNGYEGDALLDTDALYDED